MTNQCNDPLNKQVQFDLFGQQEECPCEHLFFQSAVEEFTDIAGFPIEFYISVANMDRLYGEDPNMDFIGPVTTKFVYEPSEETKIIEAFGLSSDETLQYAMIPRITFTRDVSGAFVENGLDIEKVWPKTGDVVKTLWNNRNYEIVEVGAEQRIFQGQKHVWEMILRPYRFSDESVMAQKIHMGTAETSAGTPPPTATYLYDEFGDNEYIEEESDKIDDYGDLDRTLFGY